jgi:hypothetical protein
MGIHASQLLYDSISAVGNGTPTSRERNDSVHTYVHIYLLIRWIVSFWNARGRPIITPVVDFSSTSSFPIDTHMYACTPRPGQRLHTYDTIRIEGQLGFYDFRTTYVHIARITVYCTDAYCFYCGIAFYKQPVVYVAGFNLSRIRDAR